MANSMQFFQENVQLLGGAQALAARDPEKFNLYSGLASIAREIHEIQASQKRIENQLRHLEQDVARLK